MTAQTANPITYDLSHGGHASTDPRYAVTGFDVVRTRGIGVVEVVQVIPGDATSYMEALTAAKALRAGEYYAYPAERYACGCRWIGLVSCAVDITT